jgi:hypothetical protein
MRVRGLECVVQRDVTPAAVHAVDAALAAAAAAHARAVLHVATATGDVLALGRFHRRPAGGAGVALLRRRGGGRVAAAGDGFVHLALHLPHAAALVADEAGALAPAQVLNRAVRGLLGACDVLGVPARYPGRDVVTVGARVLAVLGFDVAPDGATAVEAVLGAARDQSALPALLDRADPDGVVPAAMVGGADAVSLAAVRGAAPSLDELVAALARGFAERLDVALAPPAAAPVPAWPRDVEDAWLAARPDLPGRARRPSQLGTVEVAVACGRDGALAAVDVAGDLLAPVHALARLAERLRGVAAEPAPVRAVVAAALAPPDGFVLGIGVDALADAIVEAARGARA